MGLIRSYKVVALARLVQSQTAIYGRVRYGRRSLQESLQFSAEAQRLLKRSAHSGPTALSHFLTPTSSMR